MTKAGQMSTSCTSPSQANTYSQADNLREMPQASTHTPPLPGSSGTEVGGYKFVKLGNHSSARRLAWRAARSPYTIP